jgi:HEAT repeat protein
MAAAGDPAVPVLARLYADPQTPERTRVLDALETVGEPAATGFFSDLAGKSGAALEHRVRAAMVLFDRRDKLDKGQVRRAAELLAEKETNLVAVALQILLDAGGPEYLGRITPLAKLGDDVVRHFAIANLARFGGPEHEGELIGALSEPNGATVRLALEALARVGTRKALPSVRPLTQDPKYKRYAQAAVEAIETRPQ